MQVEQSVAGHLEAFDYDDLTINNTASGLTAAKLNPTSTQVGRDFGKCRMVIIEVEGADVRYTVHTGGTPVGTNQGSPTGHLLPNGSILTLANLMQLKNFSVVRETASNATLRVTYYR